MSRQTITGWAAWKGDECHSGSVERTKRSLLIGYDMMPLRGLAKTEMVLKSKGIMIVRTVVERCDLAERHAFCLSIRGKLDAGSMAWPITHPGGGVWKVYELGGHPILTFKSACGYVESSAESPGVSCRTHRIGPLSREDARLLQRVWLSDLDYRDPSQPEDRRRRRTHDRNWSNARAIFGRLRLELVPVRFSRVGGAVPCA